MYKVTNHSSIYKNEQSENLAPRMMGRPLRGREDFLYATQLDVVINLFQFAYMSGKKWGREFANGFSACTRHFCGEHFADNLSQTIFARNLSLE